MPKVNWPKRHKVILSEHAWERFQERAGVEIKRTKLVCQLSAKLNNALRTSGLHPDKTGGVLLEVTSRLRAVVRITDRGWIVTTFVDWSKEEAG